MLALAIASWIICGILSYAIFKGYSRNMYEEVFGKHYDNFLTKLKAEFEKRGWTLSEERLTYARSDWKKRRGYNWKEELVNCWIFTQGWIALPFALLLSVIARLESNYKFRLCFRMPKELKSR